MTHTQISHVRDRTLFLLLHCFVSCSQTYSHTYPMPGSMGWRSDRKSFCPTFKERREMHNREQGVVELGPIGSPVDSDRLTH